MIATNAFFKKMASTIGIARLTIVTAIVFVAISTVHAADDPAAGPADAANQTEAQLPGDIHVARWDFILNETGFESIDAVDNQVVHTPSKIYEGAIYNADALRAAVNAAAAVNGFEGGSQSMAITQSFNDSIRQYQPLYFNYYRSQSRPVAVQGNNNGNNNEEYEKVDDGHLHVKLNYANMNMQLTAYDPNRRSTTTPFDKSAAISYDGQLTAGDALAFSAAVTVKGGASYRHIIVWEAFKAEPRYQQNFQMMHDSERWAQLGPKWIRHDADVALVWDSHAKHDATTSPAKWEQKMEDGKILRLTAVTRSDKWLYCWWDGDGQPVANRNNWVSFQAYYKVQPVWFSVQLTGPAEEWKKETPTGHPGRNRPQQPQNGPFVDQLTTVTDNNGKATVGVPVGDWQLVGEIKKGGKIKVGTVTYTLRTIQAAGDNQIYVQFNQDRYEQQGDLVTLSVVTLDGKEIDTSYSRVLTSPMYGTPLPQFEGVSLKDVKAFHVWKRKQQWATFTGFATQPVNPPKDAITAAELADAIKVQMRTNPQMRGQVIQGRVAWTKAQRKEWDAIPADPSTAKGAVRAMFQAAAAGDGKAVRARLKASQPNADAALNAFTKFVTASQRARKTAVARFGEQKVASVGMLGAGGLALPPMMDFELVFFQGMVEQSDGSLKMDQVSVTKGADGKYAMDLTPVIAQVSGLKGAAMIVVMLGSAQRLDHINELMKNPAFTFENLRQALTDRLSFPATMPATTAPVAGR